MKKQNMLQNCTFIVPKIHRYMKIQWIRKHQKALLPVKTLPIHVIIQLNKRTKQERSLA